MQSCNLTPRPLPVVVRSASYHAHLCFQRCLGVPPDMLTCAFSGSVETVVMQIKKKAEKDCTYLLLPSYVCEVILVCFFLCNLLLGDLLAVE